MTPSAWTASVDPEPMLGVVLPTASDRKRRLLAVACCRRVEDWLVGDESIVFEERADDYREAVATAERFADGQATERELGEACGNADDSAFCNEWIQERDDTEFRNAAFGTDAGWPARFARYNEMREDEKATFLADPAAWLAIGDNAENLPASVDPFRDVAQKDAVLVGETVSRQILLITRHYGGRPREAEERAAQAALIRSLFGDPFPPPAFDPAWRTPEATTLAEGIYEDRTFDQMPILADALESAGCTDCAVLDHCRGPGPHVRGDWVLDGVLGKE